jgi:uncharacterized membrane protein
MVAAGNNGVQERGLSSFLAERARNASEGRLAVDIGVGAVAVIVAIAARPDWPLLAAAGMTLCLFGTWAIAGRALEDATHSPRVHIALATIRKVLAFAGICAAILTGFLIWTILMGTWIS